MALLQGKLPFLPSASALFLESQISAQHQTAPRWYLCWWLVFVTHVLREVQQRKHKENVLLSVLQRAVAEVAVVSPVTQRELQGEGLETCFAANSRQIPPDGAINETRQLEQEEEEEEEVEQILQRLLLRISAILSCNDASIIHHHYLTLAVVCTVGSCTVTMPSALVFPTTVGLVFRMSGAVVALTRCCSPPALLARLVSRKEYSVSGSKPATSFWVCFPSTSTDWLFPYRICTTESRGDGGVNMTLGPTAVNAHNLTSYTVSALRPSNQTLAPGASTRTSEAFPRLFISLYRTEYFVIFPFCSISGTVFHASRREAADTSSELMLSGYPLGASSGVVSSLTASSP
ncbi:hypothetical protein EYF80_006041 [Liparis tanakae]|uniref:Uncharacterized protein n=1 Tax=Liparis tanakae TaxID=230148 RepID=A0A4Z2J226_9TELE|nr:hypothetical protein EYF80_006041 [Liparis tanakae]